MSASSEGLVGDGGRFDRQDDEAGFACAVCGQGDSETIISAPDYPAYLVPLPRDLAPMVMRDELRVVACRSCGHMQQSAINQTLQRRIYEDYYSYYVVDAAESLVPYYRKPFEVFFRKLASQGSFPGPRLLEIGCAAGEQIPLFETFCKSYIGIDASHRIEVARRRFPGRELIEGFFPQALPPDNVDVLVSQFNLEHIDDLEEFLSAAHTVANKDAVLVIQVPDVEDFIRKGQPNFLAHEHIHYFRKPQLALVLARHGWNPEFWSDDAGPSLICACRRGEKIAGELVGEDDPMAVPRLQSVLFDKRPELDRVPTIFYGVGPLLYWFLQGFPAELVANVIDDNPAYLNQGLPGYDLTITALDAEMIRSVPRVVLSLNPMYHDTVLEKIRKLGTQAEVLTLQEGVLNVRSIEQQV